MLRSRSKTNAYEQLEDAIENVDAMKALCGDSRPPMLADIGQIGTQSRPARLHYQEHPIPCAVAFIATNPVARLMASFYLKLNRSDVPLAVFAESTEALAWLQQYVQRPVAESA